MPRTGSFYIESLGCAKNQVDSELMIAALEGAGWRFVSSPEEADVLIVNTCGFISQAKTESIETGLELRSRFPRKRIYMTGCLTERYGEELARELPEIDGIWGNRDPAGVPALLSARGGDRRRAHAALAVTPTLRTRLLSFAGSAYVKVADGCDNRCTYCAIPLIRGRLASRSREDVLGEIRDLLSRGIREIVLIAQDLGSYGVDRGAPELALLLREISGLSGDFWVRMLYIHPDHFPREILPVLKEDARLLPYFDIPLQHASPRILRAMGRRGEPEKNLALIDEIREAMPGATVRSTFLVGFPGETEEDFRLLLDFQARAALQWMGAFTYSREEETPAYRMRERVPKKTAEERKTRLEELQVPITQRALDGHLGRTLEVLIEERVSGEELSIGRTYMQAPDVDGLTVVRGVYQPGTVVRARIVRRNGLDLEAEPTPGTAEGGDIASERSELPGAKDGGSRPNV